MAGYSRLSRLSHSSITIKGYLSSERFDSLKEVINASALSAASSGHHVSTTQTFLIWAWRNTFDPERDSFEELEGACAQIAHLFDTYSQPL